MSGLTRPSATTFQSAVHSKYTFLAYRPALQHWLDNTPGIVDIAGTNDHDYQEIKCKSVLIHDASSILQRHITTNHSESAKQVSGVWLPNTG